MLKKFITLFAIFVCSISIVNAECWVNTTPSADKPIYIDIDNIYKKENGTFFNIKYAVNDSDSETVFIIHSRDNKAGISKYCTYNEYCKDKYVMNPRNAAAAKKFNDITSSSKIYNAYKVSKLSTYDLNRLRENSASIHSVLSSAGRKTPFAVPMPSGSPLKTNNARVTSPRPSYPSTSVKTSNSESEPNFGPYMRELQRRIKSNWSPPRGSESKKVVLLFSIDKNGQLLSCKVHKSSGYDDADDAAMRAVKLTAPFRPLPTAYKGNSVDIQFTFDYRVFGDSSK